MAHTITLSDEQFARLEAAARFYQRPAAQILSDLLAAIPIAAPPLPAEEYDRRWADFMQVVGSIQHGAPLTNDEIDELIGEEAADTHAANTEFTDAS